jgi:hypothetical protein
VIGFLDPADAHHRRAVDEFVDGIGIEIVPLDRSLARRVAQLRGARLLTFDERLRSVAQS